MGASFLGVDMTIAKLFLHTTPRRLPAVASTAAAGSRAWAPATSIRKRIIFKSGQAVSTLIAPLSDNDRAQTERETEGPNFCCPKI